MGGQGLGGAHACGQTLLRAQFCYEPKTALKNKSLLKKKDTCLFLLLFNHTLP